MTDEPDGREPSRKLRATTDEPDGREPSRKLRATTDEPDGREPSRKLRATTDEPDGREPSRKLRATTDEPDGREPSRKLRATTDEDESTAIELGPEDHDLIRKLRALPPEGSEPDWTQVEAQIRAQVGGGAPRPWWRSWRWIVPIWALATTAAVALIITRDKPSEPVRPAITAPVLHETQTPASREQASSLWLDGEALELDEIETAILDELDADARAALDDSVETDREPSAAMFPSETDAGILPVTDLGWVDALDESELDRAEHWLARKRS